MKKVKKQLPGENIYTFDNIKFIYKYPEYIKLIQFNSKNTTRLKNQQRILSNFLKHDIQMANKNEKMLNNIIQSYKQIPYHNPQVGCNNNNLKNIT